MPKATQNAATQAYWRTLWQTRSLKSSALLPLAWLYQTVVCLRKMAYRKGWLTSESAPVPVIVVGGLLVGGVGKTPLVAHLVQALQQAGFQTGIISRGYTVNGQSNTQARAVTQHSLPADVGDEPVLLQMKTQRPVWVGRNRAQTAAALCAAHPQCNVIVCDDGLQHYALQRDVALAVMDDRGVGNGWCLPAGPLRESAASLKTVDAVIWHHRSSRTDKAAQPHPSSGNPNEFDVTSHINAAYDLFDVSTRQPLVFFADKAVVGMAGIALPEVFFAMLSAQNIHGDMLALPDHYDFDDAFVHQLLQKPANHYLMTEKDAVKLRHLIAPAQRVGKTFWVVPLELVEQNSLAQLTQFVLNKIQTIHATKIDSKQE